MRLFYAVVSLPIRTQSEANLREHWRVRHGRSKAQRAAAKLAAMPLRFTLSNAAHVEIRLVRIGVRKLDDDNLARSFKAVRDGIADALGVDDGSDWYSWHYAQEKGRPKEYAVRIEVEAL